MSESTNSQQLSSPSQSPRGFDQLIPSRTTATTSTSNGDLSTLVSRYMQDEYVEPTWSRDLAIFGGFSRSNFASLIHTTTNSYDEYNQTQSTTLVPNLMATSLAGLTSPQQQITPTAQGPIPSLPSTATPRPTSSHTPTESFIVMKRIEPMWDEASGMFIGFMRSADDMWPASER